MVCKRHEDGLTQYLLSGRQGDARVGVHESSGVSRFG